MTVWQTIWGAGFGCSRGWAFARKPSRLCALPTFPKHFNGHDLRKLLVFERKALLKKIIAETDIQYSKRFEVDGGEMFEHACSIGLEGVVSEVRDNKYTSGRTKDWAEKACAQRETSTIAGSRSTAANGMACIWPDAEAAIRFTLARSITASTKTTPKNYSRASSRQSERPSPTVNALPIAASGSNRHCLRRSSTERSRLRGGSASGIQRIAGESVMVADERNRIFPSAAGC